MELPGASIIPAVIGGDVTHDTGLYAPRERWYRPATNRAGEVRKGCVHQEVDATIRDLRNLRIDLWAQVAMRLVPSMFL